MRTLLLVLLCTCCQAAVTIELREQVSVAEEWATIGSIAAIEGPAELVSAIGALRVQRLAGLHPYRIDADRVRLIIASQLGPDEELRITGQSEVIRSSQIIKDEDLYARVEAHLRAQLTDRDIAVSHERISGQISFASRMQEPRWEISALTEALWGQVAFRVRLLDSSDGKELGRALVVVRVQVIQAMPVATRAIKRGQTIHLVDLEMVERALDRRSGATPPTIDELAGRVAARAFSPGDAVTRNGTKPPLAVQAGANITLIFEDDRFQIQVTGEALTDGIVGDVIRVRQPTGRLVRAEIVGEGLAKVNF